MHGLFKENSRDVIGPDGTAAILDFINILHSKENIKMTEELSDLELSGESSDERLYVYQEAICSNQKLSIWEQKLSVWEQKENNNKLPRIPKVFPT